MKTFIIPSHSLSHEWLLGHEAHYSASGYFLQNKRMGIECWAVKGGLAHFAKKTKKGGVVELFGSRRTIQLTRFNCWFKQFETSSLDERFKNGQSDRKGHQLAVGPAGVRFSKH